MGDRKDELQIPGMDKLRTILVEDEGAALRRLEKFAAQNEMVEVVGSAKSGKYALEIINAERPDLILLDIELKDMTAFEVLANLDGQFSGQIIFITAYNQYAIEAFNIAATDYLLKPYDVERFRKAISRAYHQKERAQIKSLINILEKSGLNPSADKIKIVEGNNTHYISSHDIIWIEAEGYYSKIHQHNSSFILIRKTLKEMQSILPTEFFNRVNRSAIINKNFIERETKNINLHYYVMKGNVKVKVSSKYLIQDQNS